MPKEGTHQTSERSCAPSGSWGWGGVGGGWVGWGGGVCGAPKAPHIVLARHLLNTCEQKHGRALHGEANLGRRQQPAGLWNRGPGRAGSREIGRPGRAGLREIGRPGGPGPREIGSLGGRAQDWLQITPRQLPKADHFPPPISTHFPSHFPPPAPNPIIPTPVGPFPPLSPHSRTIPLWTPGKVICN